MNLLAAVLLAAQPAADASADPHTSDRALPVLQAYASQMRIAPTVDPAAPFEFRREPLMKWTNPTRFQTVGGIFLWTQNDRPAVIGGLFVRTAEDPWLMTHELHSVTGERITADDRGERVWETEAPGVDFHQITADYPPAASPALRLRQMKAIAARFTGEIWKHNTPAERIRMLPQPIYRFASEEAGVIDGVIMTFAQGTDPEAFLLIEARTGESESEWHAAVARQTAWAVRLHLDDQVFYEVDTVKFPLSARGLAPAFLMMGPAPIDRNFGQ